MMTKEEKLQQKQKAEEQKQEAFEKWLEQPMTKLTISMIPAGDNKEALLTLLHAAYDTGYACGCGHTAIEVLDSIMRAQKPKP